MKAQTKKALSASTPKALNLKVIPLPKKDNSMKNNTAVQLNNQSLSDLAVRAKDQSEFMQKAARSINAITQRLQISFSNYCDGVGETLPDNEVSSLLEAIDLLSADIENRGRSLEKSLINGGL